LNGVRLKSPLIALLVLGDRCTINNIAASYVELYGVKPKLGREGSLDELYRLVRRVRAGEPANYLMHMKL
jgi:hypothetical protein